MARAVLPNHLPSSLHQKVVARTRLAGSSAVLRNSQKGFPGLISRRFSSANRARDTMPSFPVAISSPSSPLC
jgi:hypothetical protein